ncbi:MAG: WD40 repeat domain-containing protein [Anaerolineales bacterium]
MNTKTMYYFIIAGLMITGCSTGKQQTSTPQLSTSSLIVQASTTPTLIIPSPSPTSTKTPVPLPPSSTPSPSPSPLPTDTATPTLTPIAWGDIPISSENASSILQKGVWGLGIPQDSGFSIPNNMFIQVTPFGVYLYRSDDLQLIRFLPEMSQFLLSPAVNLLFGRLSDGSVQVIDLPSGKDRYIFQPIAILSPWMKDYVYAQSPTERPAMEKYFFDQVSVMRSLAVNPENTLVAIGFGDASVGLWDLQSGAFVQILKNDLVNNVSRLVFSPNGEKLLSNGDDGEIAVWQVENGQLLWRLPKVGHVVGQPFSMDGSCIAVEITKGSSSWVVVLESQYGERLGVQVVGSAASQAISPDNKLLVTTWYQKVEIWSLPNMVWQAKINTGLDWPRASFSSDGGYILMNDGEQAYYLSDLSKDETYPSPKPSSAPEVNTRALQLMGHLSGVVGLRYPMPEQAFAWGKVSDHEAWVWDLSKTVQTIYDFNSPLMADPDLSFNGDRLAACTTDGLILITLASHEISNFGPCREPALVLFSTDGNTIFRGNDSLIDAINSSNGELLYNLRGHTFVIENMAITLDGKYLLSASICKRGQGREMIWWQIDQPKQVLRWMESVFPYDYLFAADFQPLHRVLYAALGGLRSWRLTDGQPDHLDTNDIRSLSISPKNNLLATGDFNGVIHIWSVEDWKELTVLSGHRQQIEALAFSPDGTNLFSLSTDGTIRLWTLP